MSKYILLISLLLFSSVALMAFGSSRNSSSNVFESNVYEFSVLDIEGNKVDLSKYKGKVSLIVNTASKCGYTPQYKGLQAIYDKYKDDGFVVIGFPANNFGGQEPGSNEEIKEFCTSKYKVSFPMFAKISVKGEDQEALYKFLTNKELHPDTGGDITWNFNKFLIDKDGKVIARFSSKDAPESEKVTNAIDLALAK